MKAWPLGFSNDCRDTEVMVYGHGHGYAQGSWRSDIATLLFAEGQVGSLFDPSNIGSLWQDSARSIRVTADGDRVGAMDDLSGNANHLLQATAGLRPTYKTDGTKHWIETTALNRWLQALGYTKSQIWDRMSGVQQVSWANSANIFYGGTGPQGTLQQIGTTPSIAIYNSGYMQVTGESLATDMRIYERYNGATSIVQVDEDSEITGSTGLTTDSVGLTLFASNGGTVSADAKCYGLIERVGGFTTAERAAAAAWIDQRIS